jgi:Tfp pilus assembly protein PilF
METENQPDSSGKNKSRTYFTLAFVFLVAMALSWSVDASLIYIFLGVACFFLFLGFYSTPRPSKPHQREERRFQSTGSQKPETEIPLTETFRNFFQRTNIKFPPRGSGGPINAPKLVKFFGIGFFLIFIIPIIISIFRGENGSGADDYFSAGEQFYFSQQYDSAYISYRRAMQQDPENAQAIVGYGNVLVIRNERDSAIMMFNRALEINPEYKEASYNKALALYDQKKYNEGIEVLQPVLDANPDYYNAMLLMGDCYYIQKKYDEAILWYENAYQNGGMRSSMLCHIMAYIYDTKGEPDKAINLYQEALSYDSTIVDIYRRLGELLPGEDGNFYRIKAAQLPQ